MNMGTMTINVDDETEGKFRKTVLRVYGSGKGKLGMAVGQALSVWSAKNEQEKLREKALAIIEMGADIDVKGLKMRREDMYEERDAKNLPR